MGLDCTAYSNLRFVGHHTADRDHLYEGDDHIEGYAYSAFPHALSGITEPHHVTVRKIRSLELITVGCLEKTQETERQDFDAGSYGGFGRWRRELSLAFNLPPDPESHYDPEKPFYELIWFADNEGTLLAPACINLAKDFEENREEFRDHILARYSDVEAKYFLDSYETWARATKLAANGGLIDFH